MSIGLSDICVINVSLMVQFVSLMFLEDILEVRRAIFKINETI